VRFPFGRGARQRELDGLRQRIVELQDEISKIEDSLAVESPDVETTDAYRSVQLLRESMRREELATLRQELRGLDARLETLTADRRKEAAAVDSAPLAEAVAQPETAAAPPREQPNEPTVEANQASESEPMSSPAAVTGRGLPSERAIIEPPLPAHAPASEVAPIEAEAGDARAAPEEEPLPAAQEAIAGPAETPELPGEALTTEPVAAALDEPAADQPLEPAVTDDGTPEEPGDEEAQAAVSEEPMAVESAAATDTTAVEEPTAASQPIGAAEPISAVEPESAEAEPTEEEPAEGAVVEAPPRRRRGRWIAVTLLVILALAAVVAVGALESGLIGPTAIAPTAVPTVRPTLPPTAVPTISPPAVLPTLPATPPPPTVVPAGLPADEAARNPGLTLSPAS
jgi:hypothetical protein